MDMPYQSHLTDNRVPERFLWALFGLSVLPLIVIILFSFSPGSQSFLHSLALTPYRHHLLHAFLEWTAVITSLLTALLAFAHFKINHDIITPLIGFAWFAAGIMDAFHTLAGDGVISIAAPAETFLPFTWLLSRSFNALVLTLGLILVLLFRNWFTRQRLSFLAVVFGLLLSIILGVAYVTIGSPHLPRTIFPDQWLKRPLELIPLVLFLVVGLQVFRRYYQRIPSFFAHALLLSLLPQVMAELHMAFGSRALFDANFYAAHFLKNLAYFVPFGGLVLEYVKSFHKEKVAMGQLRVTQDSLIVQAGEMERINEKLASEIKFREQIEKEQEVLNLDLERANRELKEFAYVVSHDLKAPLRAIGSLADWISTDYAHVLDEAGQEQLQLLMGRVKRMHNLIEGILKYSRVGKSSEEKRLINTGELVKEVIELIEPPSHVEVKIATSLPTLFFERTPLLQVFQNLISNAVKFMDKPRGEITISCEEQDNFWQFCVQDNGPGIDEQHFERIFQIFQTLKPRDEVESTGIGLSIVKKIVENAGGRIWLHSEPGEGASFIFTFPKNLIEEMKSIENLETINAQR